MWKDFIIKSDDVPATKEDRGGGEREGEKKGGREGGRREMREKKSLQNNAQWLIFLGMTQIFIAYITDSYDLLKVFFRVFVINIEFIVLWFASLFQGRWNL